LREDHIKIGQKEKWIIEREAVKLPPSPSGRKWKSCWEIALREREMLRRGLNFIIDGSPQLYTSPSVTALLARRPTLHLKCSASEQAERKRAERSREGRRIA
jgi:hypothetical protein